jgi:tripartite ATP-independent transporter DctP family solute receptor
MAAFQSLRILLTLLPAVAFLASTGCGRRIETGPVVLRAVTNNSVESGHYAGLQIFKRLVEDRTRGAVKVEIYTDGVLGDEEEMVEGMKMGTVHVMMAAAAKYANFVPEMDLYSVPYVFDSWEHFKAVMASDVDDRIRKAVREQTGDHYVGCLTDGVRSVFTRKPIRTLEELSGVKLRTMTGPNEVRSWKALGTSPTPLAYTELYAALQSGVVDGAENTMTSLLTMKFHESCKFVLQTHHNFLALPFFISGRALDKVPGPLREAVLQAGRDTCAEQVDQAIALDLRNKEALRQSYGVQIFDFSRADALRARELCRPVQEHNAARIGMTAEWRRLREIGDSIQSN